MAENWKGCFEVREKNLLSFGEILWDVFEEEKHIGGAPLNFAAHFSKQGGKAYMLSAVGKDELGKVAFDLLKKWDICSCLALSNI